MKKMKRTFRRRLHEKLFKLPLMISCEEFENFILAYLDDDLPSKQRIIFELHIKMCRECHDYLRAYRASMDLAKSAMEDQETVLSEQVPDDFVKAVLAARKS